MMSSARFIPANLDNCTGASVLETKCSENGCYALISAGGDAKDCQKTLPNTFSESTGQIVGNNWQMAGKNLTS